MAHPARWTGLYLERLAILYYHDVPFQGYFAPNQGYIAMQREGGNFVKLFLERALCSTVYYGIMVVFLIALWRRRRMILTSEGLVLLVPLFGTLITCVFQTMPRYHYPFMPFFILWAASLWCLKKPNSEKISQKQPETQNN